MGLNYIDDADFQEKKVIARFDFNVPLKEGKILDTTRIDAALPTIKKILEGGATHLILMSHLGRPKGRRNNDLSLLPVAEYLAEQLNEDVLLTESALDRGIKTIIKLKKNKILLLENLRFHPEEEAGCKEFAKSLSDYADLYVNDAFGTAHRKHASTYHINTYFKNKSYGGYLLKNEISALNNVVDRPKSPFVAIVGGAKVSDKIKIIDRLLSSVESLIIGGAMAYPFLKAKGHGIGTSLCSEEDVKLAKKILKQSFGMKILLPLDHITSLEFAGSPIVYNDVNIPDDQMGLDIGPKSVEYFKTKIQSAKTILWNGPMGLFEYDEFSKGTFDIANALAESNAYTLVGGGDSVSAINKTGLSEKMSHVSTGGGASLEFIENGTLPGIDALKFGINL
ncbi:MAG: phosphoglycerate kinase [Bacteriovoracaceae bacterium]|jgi:phosphoglycerate kinase|nr:phosphoglycerate kinase [Bacteriovoracaceae bacterium]